MAYEMKEGDFSLFKNEKKTESNHPDYTGKIMVGGVVKRMAAWIKSREGGTAFFTGNISEFKQQDASPVEDPINPPPQTAKPKTKKAADPHDTEDAANDLPF